MTINQKIVSLLNTSVTISALVLLVIQVSLYL